MRATKGFLCNRYGTSLLAPAVILLAAVFWSAAVCGQGAPEAAVRLKGEVLSALQSATKLPKVEAAAEQPITLTIMMNLSDPAGFDAYSRGFADRASPLYRKRLAPEELMSRFGPSQASYDAVAAYLRQNGFALVAGSSNRLTLTVRGTRAQAERAFDVSISDYQLGTRHFYANDADPAIPQSLAPMIRSVSGLSNLAQHRALAAPAPASPLSFATAYNGVLTPATGGNTGGLSPGLNGAGQKIALIEFDNYVAPELTASLTASGLPATLSNQVSSVAVNGGTGRSGLNGTAEVLLDLVITLGVAPGANVIVVNAPNGTPDIGVINSAFDQVKGAPGQQPGIISDSWLECEEDFSDSDLNNMEFLLQTLRIYGVSFFAAAGDNGSSCLNGQGTLNSGVSLPSDAPDAVAVGGTTLQAASGNGYQSESWWSGGGLAGGFGVSQHFGRPSYQDFYTNAAGRSVPDVSADGGDWMATICILGKPCGPQRGTSASAPFWAATWALACQATSPCPSADGSFLYSLDLWGGFHLAKSMDRRRQ